MKEDKEADIFNLTEIKDEKNLEDKKFDLRILYCKICDREFSSAKSFKNHKQNHDNRTFTCLNCGKQLLGLKKFDEHMHFAYKNKARPQWP